MLRSFMYMYHCISLQKAGHQKLLVCCAPSYPPKLALPKNFYGHFEENIYIFFFQKSKNKDSFSQNYSFQNLFYVLTMFYYTVLTSIYPILNHLHLLIKQIIKIFFWFQKKKMTYLPTYLPTLKLMGRSTANKESFKDGPILFHVCLVLVPRKDKYVYST